MVPSTWYLLLSAALFVIGILGVLLRRNTLVVLMSAELMLNAANLALASFAFQRQDAAGQVIVFFVISVAAAEVAVGLALLVVLHKSRQTVDIDAINKLRG